MQALDTVNMILNSSLQQTRYWEQTNLGAYIALVSEDDPRWRRRTRQQRHGLRGVDRQLDPRRQQRRRSSSASGSSRKRRWATRRLRSSTASLTVTAEPSTDQPLGQFTLYFKNLAADRSLDQHEHQLRRLPAHDRAHRRPERSSSSTCRTATSTARRRSTSTPCGTACTSIGDPTNGFAGRAYTESVFKMNNGIGLHRRRRIPDRVQRGLPRPPRRHQQQRARRCSTATTTTPASTATVSTTRHVTEERVEQMSGFPITDSQGANGWAGFYGIWFPEGHDAHQRRHGATPFVREQRLGDVRTPCSSPRDASRSARARR